MVNDEKQIRKAARCIHYILEAKGKSVTPKKIMDLIKEEDLTDVTKLQAIVEDALRRQLKEEKATRKRQIESFLAKNWELVNENDAVKSALISAYCRGRFNKEQRQQMQDDLISKCTTTSKVESSVDNKYDF